MAIGSKWAGSQIKNCQICERPIQCVFVDGRTRSGQWAIMCPSCRIDEGLVELGEGLGQKYERHNGEFVRTV